MCYVVVDGIEEKKGRSDKCEVKHAYNRLMTELVRHLASTLPSIALKTGNASKVNLKHATSATSGLGVALESVKSGTPLVFLDVRPRPSLADATDRAALVAAARREHEKFCDQLVANGTPETLDCCSIAYFHSILLGEGPKPKLALGQRKGP